VTATDDDLQEELRRRAHRYGWNDCPMPCSDPARVPAGVKDGINLDDSGGKRARQVFHAALAASLQDRGDRTAEFMQGKLGWFKLRYTNNELQDVLDTATRYRPKVIDATERGRLTNATGERNPVIGNVVLSPTGEKLTAPRGASLTDLTKTGVLWTVLMWKGFDGFSGVVKLLVGLFPLASLAVGIVTKHYWLLVALVVMVWWTFVLAIGYRGERALKAAALAWRRLELYRPCRYRYETHRWRHWFFPVMEWLFVLLVAGTLLLWLQVSSKWSWLGWTGDDWAMVTGWAAALLALAGIVVNGVCIRPLSVAWKEEADAVNRWRFEGRPDLSAPDGLSEWVPQLPPATAAAPAQPGGAYAERAAAAFGSDDAEAFADQDALAPPSAEGPGGEL
jgi:hypothetical protein